MPSQSPGIYILLSGVLAAIISGIFSVWNNEKQRIWQLEREEQQRIWQLEREEQQRIWQEKNDQQKWYREKIYDSYKKSIQVLIKIMQEAEIDPNKKDSSTVIKKKYFNQNQSKLSIEFAFEFSIVTARYPGKESKEFNEKMAEINKTVDDEPWIAMKIVTELMEDDLRIKGINK